MPFWHMVPNGVSVSVKVQPKSRRPGVQGKADSANGPCLRIGVAEPPEDGKANHVVCILMATVLGVPARDVTVTLGHTSRDKTISINGDGARLSSKLEAL